MYMKLMFVNLLLIHIYVADNFPSLPLSLVEYLADASFVREWKIRLRKKSKGENFFEVLYVLLLILVTR